jgi:hypothetical protein
MTDPIPTLPQPVVDEPSAMRIMDTVQGFMRAWLDVLKRVDVEELANEFDGLDLEQKLNLDKKMLAIRPEFRAQVQTMGQDVRPYRIWERFRETYEPHPALSRALVNMKSGTKIPGDVFRRLRHPNPLFLLTGAPAVNFPDGHTGRLIALFICGAVSKKRQRPGDEVRVADDAPGNASVLLDTHDPHINSYHVMAISEVHGADGQQVTDLDWCHLTIPIKNEFTLDSLARDTAAAGFNWTFEQEVGEDKRYDYLLDITRITVAHLLYVCSRTVEVDEKPRASRPPGKRKKGEPRPPSAARIRRVGWRLGAAIQDSVRRVAATSSGAGTGKKVAPHMRSAHLHTYLVGPGRQEVEMKWLDPIAVNADKDDGTTITVHPVR